MNDLPEVRECLIQILQALPGLPQRLHLSAGEVTVELEWPTAGQPTAGQPAAGQPAGGQPAAGQPAAVLAEPGEVTAGRTVATGAVAESPAGNGNGAAVVAPALPASVTAVGCAAVNAATMSRANAAGGTPDIVCSPSVGTFYRAPEPGAPPFVAEGDPVQPGQQIAIVEAMKLMLPVEATRAGRVIRILKSDGEPVEYGEPLLELAAQGESG